MKSSNFICDALLNELKNIIYYLHSVKDRNGDLHIFLRVLNTTITLHCLENNTIYRRIILLFYRKIIMPELLCVLKSKL